MHNRCLPLLAALERTPLSVMTVAESSEYQKSLLFVCIIQLRYFEKKKKEENFTKEPKGTHSTEMII